jgi:hypothetical protein
VGHSETYRHVADLLKSRKRGGFGSAVRPDLIKTVNANSPQIGTGCHKPKEGYRRVVIVPIRVAVQALYRITANFNDTAAGHEMDEPNCDGRATFPPRFHGNSVYWVAVGIQ